MDTRKIQEVGGGTFTVSLPPDWARSADLSQGDTVALHTHIDGVLVVHPHTHDTDGPGGVTIELETPDTDQIIHSLWTAYTAGYTEITLTTQTAFTSSQRQVATEVANVLAGVTVTSASEHTITSHVLLDPEEISVRQLVRQLSFVALSMHRAAMAAVADGQSTLDVTDREDQADRLFALTERSFARALARLSEVDSLGVTRPHLFELWSTARDLERIADHADRIASVAGEFDEPPDGEHIGALQTLAEDARDVVDDAVRGIIDTEGTDTVWEALKLRADIRDEVGELDRRLFGDATAHYRLAYILDSVRRTAEHGGNIAERGVQRAIRRRNGESVDGAEATVGWAGATPSEPPSDSD